MDGMDGMDGTLVRRGWDEGTNVSRRRNGRATIGAGTGAPPLCLEGRKAVGSSGWYQLRQCCKEEDYFLAKQKNNINRLHTNRNYHIVQDSIKNMYDTIVLWLHTNPKL